jgi:hypothetical protein
LLKDISKTSLINFKSLFTIWTNNFVHSLIFLYFDMGFYYFTNNQKQYLKRSLWQRM